MHWFLLETMSPSCFKQYPDAVRFLDLGIRSKQLACAPAPAVAIGQVIFFGMLVLAMEVEPGSGELRASRYNEREIPFPLHAF